MTYPSADDPNAQPAGEPHDPPAGYTLPPEADAAYPPAPRPEAGPPPNLEYPVVPPQPGPYPIDPAQPGPYQAGPPPHLPYQPDMQPSPFGHQGPPHQHSAPPYPGPGQPQPMSPYPGQPHQPTPPPAWQPPPPAAATKSRSPLGWILGGVALLLVLCLGGGVLLFNSLANGDFFGTEPSATSDPATPSSTATAEPSATGTVPPGGTYAMISNLCTEIDLSPLGDWAREKEGLEKNDSEVEDLYQRAECRFDLRSAEGVKVTLNVAVQVFEELADAKDDYEVSLSFDQSMYYDTTISGLGDEAYGTSRDWDLGLKVSTYTVELRSGNLSLSTEVTTFADAYTPKSKIKDKTVAEAKAILATLAKG
ncbi:MAG: hypothetical protein HKP61_15400 [Dactylosporangium sp.]|nr:hypothetical protein [Dactylosporangium sp.]NNJ62294.1 hypothetical protein [Dactylosporangium sp.]